MQVIKLAKERGYPFVLILEDDVYFCDDFNNKLNWALYSLPANWDALWLNGTTRGQNEPYNGLVERTTCTWGAFGYVLRNTCYDKMIELLSENKDRVDGYYTQIQGSLNCFKTKEKLVLHRKGFSEIQQKEKDYAHLR